MSIPKNGQFHKHQAYVSRVNATVRLTSYQSVVADFLPATGNSNNYVILYPRWQYSPSTVRQVTRFLAECTGLWYGVDELRSLAKQQARGITPVSGNCLFTFSTLFPRG